MPVQTRSQTAEAEAANDITAIDIHCLVPMTPSEISTFTTLATTPTDSSSSSSLPVRPNLIPWPHPHDGTPADLYRIYKESVTEELDFLFFIDRVCLSSPSDPSVIVAQPDHYTLIYSDAAQEVYNAHLATYPIEHLDSIHEGHLESIEAEALDRGLTYGRVPASELDSVWGNLEIANMDMSELVEYCGGREAQKMGQGMGKVEIVENPEWDVGRVMRRLGEVTRPEAKL